MMAEVLIPIIFLFAMYVPARPNFLWPYVSRNEELGLAGQTHRPTAGLHLL